jgi:hypothetical protein
MRRIEIMDKFPPPVFNSTSASTVKVLPSRRFVISVLPLLPIVYLLVLILWFSVDVPFWDEWDFVPFLGQVYQGTWSIWDVWKSHNEHRIVFPELVLLTLAWVSHWNKLYELLANSLLAIGTFLVLLRYTIQNLHSVAVEKSWWLPCVISLLMFSLNQFENWFMGIQLCVFLNVFSIVAGYGLLSQSLANWRCFLGAVGFGVIATFSFSNGLLYWPIALIMLFLLAVAERKRNGLKLLLWSLIGLIITWVYFYDFDFARSPLAAETAYTRAFSSYVSYVFSYLGGPLAIFAVRTTFGPLLSAVVGTAGIATFGLLLWCLIYHYQIAMASIVYPSALGCYAIGSALMTAMGRANLGLTQALSSRYIIFSSLLWIANAILLAFLSGVRAKTSGLTEKSLKTHEYIGAVVTVVLLFLSSTGGTVATMERAAKRIAARDELLRPQNVQRLQPLYPDITVVIERAKTLQRYHLSLFREARTK